MCLLTEALLRVSCFGLLDANRLLDVEPEGATRAGRPVVDDAMSGLERDDPLQVFTTTAVAGRDVITNSEEGHAPILIGGDTTVKEFFVT